MKDFSTALDQIFTKVGAAAGIAACWLFFQVQELNNRVENLDQTTKDLAEVKIKVASIDAKLGIILNDFVSKHNNEHTSP